MEEAFIPQDSEFARFHSRVSINSYGCAIWTGAKGGNGYGNFRSGGRVVLAHRYAYERYVGPLEAGLVIDHLCRVPLCVNPDHLRQCTPQQNTLEARSKAVARVNSLATHCPQGHPYDEANTHVDRRGSRSCRRCRRERAALRRQSNSTTTKGSS